MATVGVKGLNAARRSQCLPLQSIIQTNKKCAPNLPWLLITGRYH